MLSNKNLKEIPHLVRNDNNNELLGWSERASIILWALRMLSRSIKHVKNHVIPNEFAKWRSNEESKNGKILFFFPSGFNFNK